MKSIKTLSIVAAMLLLALSSMACSITIDRSEVQPGDITTTEINEAAQGNDAAEITVEMGAGKLNIEPGADNLVQGEVRTNISQWIPEVDRDGNNITISQGTGAEIHTDGVVNEWNLKLGSQPMDLTIKAGAYEGTLDLSGLSITKLEINDGASEATVEFNEMNPVRMENLIYQTGASTVTLRGLGNANFEQMNFDGGAGSYTLDFTGGIQQDCRVDVNGGVSNVELVIPEDTNVKIVITGGLNNVELEGAWDVDGSIYTAGGEGPLLTIDVDMGVGNLQLVRR